MAVTTGDLRALMAARLDPLDSWRADAGVGHSDYDLNPGAVPQVESPPHPAAVLIPLVQRPEGLTVLLTVRSDALTSHAGQIAFPGGRLEPGEGPVGAAVREAWEEIGLDPALVEPVGLSTRYETVTRFIVTPVVAFVAPGFVLQPNPSEVADVFETPFAFLMDPANLHRESYAYEGGVRWYYTIAWEGRRIWGATAGMLRALGGRLYGAGE